MKKFLMCCMALLFAGLAFISCEKNEGISKNKIVGKWNFTAVTIQDKGGEPYTTPMGSNDYFELFNDGLYVISTESSYKETGTWRLENDELITNKGTGSEVIWKIKELTSSQLILEISVEIQQGVSHLETYYLHK